MEQKQSQKNYRYFIIVPATDGKAAGIAVLFPPYQVAAYSEGKQTVFIATEVFSAQLKNNFRAAFSGKEPSTSQESVP